MAMCRSRLSVFAFAIICGCAAHARACPFWHLDTRPLSISSWNPPKTAISCPWKPYVNRIRGHTVEGKACDWNKIRCNAIYYGNCVQTTVQISEDQEILVACLPHQKKAIPATLTQPTIVSRRRRGLHQNGCRNQRRKLCHQHRRTRQVWSSLPKL